MSEIDPAFAHDPDRNAAWRPKVAYRRYACEQCGTEQRLQTNHTGRVPAARCVGSCRDIANPHTARERVFPWYGPHRYLGEVEPEPPEIARLYQDEGGEA